MRTWTILLCSLALLGVAHVARAAEEVHPCDGPDLEQRITACSALIETPDADPKRRATAYANRAFAYSIRGEFQTAIDDYDAAIAMFPQFAVALNNYPRPIPTPVHNLRPARETCETCHWPQKYGEDRIRVIPKYAEDESNTLTKTVLLMKIGGGNHRAGIHGTHLGQGVRIRYGHSDEARQTIPWVEYSDSTGRKTTYVAPDTKPGFKGADGTCCRRFSSRTQKNSSPG